MIRDQFASDQQGALQLSCFTYFIISQRFQHSDHVRCFLIDYSKAFDTATPRVFIKIICVWLRPTAYELACWLPYRQNTVSGDAGRILITTSSKSRPCAGTCGFLAYIANLRPKDKTKTYCNFADNLTALMRDEAKAATELAHIQQWSAQNKLQINLAETKEIVIRRLRAGHFSMPPMVYNIEQVDHVKLLGVHFNCFFNFGLHVDITCQIISQRFYLLQQLRRQGMKKSALQIVFNALVLSKIVYACSAYSGYLRHCDLQKLQAICNKAHRFGFTTQKIDIKDNLDIFDYKFFKAIKNNREHCLHPFLPIRFRNYMQLRDRGHPYDLPLAKTEQHKSSYLVRCLYQYI